MKLTIIAALTVSISGCAPYAPNAISNSLYGPARASDAEIAEMTKLAWSKYQEGLSIESACSQANDQLKTRSQNPSYGTAKCGMSLREKAQAAHSRQIQEEADRNRRAQAQRRAEEFQNRIAMIRAGQADIQTKDEAVAIYGASDGQQLASRPLIRPDSKKYVISGFIDAAGDLQQNRFLLRSDEHAYPRYAYIYFHNGISLPPSAHAESQLFVVGDYIGNKPYDTRFGERKSMPVFQAEFVKVLN
ncbi:hypothetical protein [Castellaniella ginsengisoli]|uniref:DUF4398 domain-containing protein n=1 Tax=Castellaniella ginsengisoli TaxID=546114 RepID=A0AB39CTV5_9BURK